MAKCIECGFCGFNVDLMRGMQWYEMDRATRQAFLENQDRNPPGQNPGTGHWNYLRCAKYLQEWAEWNDGPPSRDALKETFVRERDCNGFGEHRAGLTPQEHPLFVPSDVLRVPDKLEFDVFLSHSSLDDNLCEDITVLLIPILDKERMSRVGRRFKKKG